MITESVVWPYSSILKLDQSDSKLNSKLRKKNSLSNFDFILQKLWSEKLKNDQFRYKFESVETDYKIIEKLRPCKTSLPYIVHVNESRFKTYKKPEKIPFKKMNEDFNPEKFSFLKINPDEILFKLSGNFKNDYVIINSAPLEFGHILLLPELGNKHRQSLNLHALYSAVHLLRLSGSNFFKVMFNSLQGGASVNHLHIHGMYSMYEKHSDNLLLKSLNRGCVTVFKTADSVNPGYVIDELACV